MKILVTGGHGYLGGYICQSLIEAGHEVVSIDVKSDQSSVSKSILADFSDKMILKTPHYQVIVGDIEQAPYTTVDTIGIDHQR